MSSCGEGDFWFLSFLVFLGLGYLLTLLTGVILETRSDSKTKLSKKGERERGRERLAFLLRIARLDGIFWRWSLWEFSS